MDLYTNVLFGVISFTIGITLLYLRLKAKDLPTTQSQSWGLSLLAWLFISNAVGMFVSYFSDAHQGQGIQLIFWDIQGVPPLFLIGFSLVFPQPVVRPSRIWMLFLGLAAVAGIMLGITMIPVYSGDTVSKLYPGIPGNFMAFGWIIALFRWVQLYVKNPTRPEISMISTLLIWGVLYTSIFYLVFDSIPLGQLNYQSAQTLSNNAFLVLTIIAVLIICYQLYMRRENWQTSERIHVFMFLLTLGLSIVYGAILVTINGKSETPYEPLHLFFVFITQQGGQDIVRPLMIIYSILAFQFFGHELKAERPTIMISTIMIAYVGGYLFSVLFTIPGMSGQGQAGFAFFFIALIPAYLISKRFVKRAIPAVRDLSRKEARDIYFISFFSSLFQGNVEDPRDKEALSDLRKRLNITEREQALLVEYEKSRARVGMALNRVKYALFVTESGNLVGSVGLMGDKDDMILAGMLTAVRVFIKDAFGSTKGDVDTIQYGETKLLMEWERGYILAVEVEGEIDPATKSVVGDILAVLMRRHGKVLKDWDGNLGDLKPIQADLEALISNYNKTGSL